MEVGAPVWLRDQDLAWIRATIEDVAAKQVAANDKAVAKCNVRLRLENGSIAVVESAYEQGSQSELADVKLADVGQGNDDSSNVDDLIRLTMLHEPSILDVLCRRYENQKIYTYTGPILLALNPFQRLPILYSSEMLANYYSVGLLRGKGANAGAGAIDDAGQSSLPPHVYAVADASYRSMVDAMSASGKGGTDASGPVMRNQSMLISGESGAGKTETTKIAMSYLATVGRSHAQLTAQASASSSAPPTASGKSKEGGDDDEEGGEGQTSVEARVLDSNPILEAFGNAKTLRNENSSRFGKFIELQFDRRGHLVGARIQTYLLEKVRLVTQGRGERNYHAFYQLMSGAKDKERKAWGLVGKGPQDFAYTASSGCFSLKGVDDGQEFAATTKAMRTLGLKKDARKGVFSILAGVLHLGCITFEQGPGQDGGERSSVTTASAMALGEAARLLGLETKALTSILVQQKLDVRGDITYRTFPPNIAADTRDALAKQVYGRLFDWLVQRVNASIRADDATRSFIGVLDIFGFESFETNSFEQLCINFANETLQQHFNAYVFKIEQAEYAREAIAWSAIDFQDNEDVLAMIAAKKPAGLLPLLDETCMMPKGDDSMYARKVYEQLKAHVRFEATARHKAREQFIVRHYAGEVVYTALGFCDKNRDTIHNEALEVMATSSSPILAVCFAPGFGVGKDDDVPAYARDDSALTPVAPASASNSMAAAAAANAKLKATVGTQFTNQLRSLMAIIRGTRSHYIRCLKPNSSSVPSKTERVSLVGQLRCGGVLEAVRVSRLGYPVRLPHAAAIMRYRAVAFARLARLKRAALGVKGAGGMKSPGAGAATGVAAVPLTFVDLSDSKLAKADAGKMKAACADALRVLGAARDQYQVGLTKVFFRKGSYETVERARSDELKTSVLSIQRCMKGWLARRQYKKLLLAILRMQCRVRGWIARRVLQALRRVRAALRLQTRLRSFIARSRYVSYRDSVVVMQAGWRGIRGRRVAREMRRESAATSIQCAFRSFLCRKAYVKQRGAAVAVQCAIRAWRARALLARLKKEAKDLSSMKEEYVRMKSGYAALEEALASALRQAAGDVEAVSCRVEAERSAAAAARAEAEAARLAAASAAADIEQLQEEVSRMQSRLSSLQSDVTAAQEGEAVARVEVEASARGRREAVDELLKEREAAAAQRAAWQAHEAEATMQPLLDAAEAQLASTRADLAAARAEREGVEAARAREGAEAHAREAASRAQIAELQQQVESAAARVEGADAQAASAAERAVGMSAQIQALREQMDEKDGEMHSVRSELALLKQSLEASRAETSTALGEIDRLKSSSEIAQDKLRSVQGEAGRKLGAAESALARALNEATASEKVAAEARAALAIADEKIRDMDRDRSAQVHRIAALEETVAGLRAGKKAAAVAAGSGACVPVQVSASAADPSHRPIDPSSLTVSTSGHTATSTVTSTSGKVGGGSLGLPAIQEVEAGGDGEEVEVEEGGVDSPRRGVGHMSPPTPPVHTPSNAAGGAAAMPKEGQGREGSAAAAGAQMGWLFTRSNSMKVVVGSGAGVDVPIPASAPIQRRTSMAEAAFSALMGTGSSISVGGGKPAVSDRERRAAELAAILIANGDLQASAAVGPSTSAGVSGGGAAPRRGSVLPPKPGLSLGPMSSLSSGSGDVSTIQVGGVSMDIASLARKASGGEEGAASMMGDIMREMGQKMVVLKAQGESAAREARIAVAGRDEAVARLTLLEGAMMRLQGQAVDASKEARRVGREADDMVSKMSALEQMAEMASGVKLALAQRLEAALGEVVDLGEQLAQAQAALTNAQRSGPGQSMPMQSALPVQSLSQDTPPPVAVRTSTWPGTGRGGDMEEKGRGEAAQGPGTVVTQLEAHVEAVAGERDPFAF